MYHRYHHWCVGMQVCNVKNFLSRFQLHSEPHHMCHCHMFIFLIFCLCLNVSAPSFFALLWLPSFLLHFICAKPQIVRDLPIPILAPSHTHSLEQHETRSSGNVETTSSSPSGGLPSSAVSPASSMPSPQDVGGMPMPPHHPAAGGGRQRPSTVPNPVSPTPAGSLTASRPQQTLKGHRQQLHQSIAQKSFRSLTARPIPLGTAFA